MSSAIKAVQRASSRILGAGKRIIAGQPTHETHPEILEPGEIQPGITAAEFALRRQRLADSLPAGSVAILQSAPQFFMTGVIPFPYRQDADFQYMTGMIQPHSVVAVQSMGKGSPHKFVAIVPDHDGLKETWDGARMTPDAALEFFGADEAYTVSEAGTQLEKLLASAPIIAFDGDKPDPFSEGSSSRASIRQLPAFQKALQQQRIQHLRPTMHQLRWRKSDAELNLMRMSAAAAGNAMKQCMTMTRQQHASTGTVSEHRIASLFEYVCRDAGAQRMAYPPVVAGGADALTIHYSRNDKKLKNDELLLLDGGCEYYGYCSDVTRTWPITGKFSSAQRDVYEAVLSTHRKVVSACVPGVTLRQLHQLSVRLLSEALCTLGVVGNRTPDAVIADHSFRRYYPHSVGHWLGLDTHDSSSVSHDKPLEPGVVLTVEPGLYIPNMQDVYGHLAGIGIRLEDDVVVTSDGPEVLSKAAPLEPDDVEAAVSSGSL